MKSGWEDQDASFSSDEEAMESRLWAYIDGFCSKEECSEIETLLAAHAEWKAKYASLLQLHQLVESTELEQPSMRFSRIVMEEIAKYHIAPATRNYINKKIIWGIAAFFITIIVGFLVYAISQSVPSAYNDGGGFAGIDYSRVDYTGIFSNNYVNAFMMVNIVLGLLLLDRYLAQQKSSWKQKSA